ncbi:MAG: hypothetical protein PHZ25_04285 [Candidatus Pacebacteria bacterium]|nr:hypothetical protein [Candidatus Paceibacterota bacterium]
MSRLFLRAVVMMTMMAETEEVAVMVAEEMAAVEIMADLLVLMAKLNREIVPDGLMELFAAAERKKEHVPMELGVLGVPVLVTFALFLVPMPDFPKLKILFRALKWI